MITNTMRGNSNLNHIKENNSNATHSNNQSDEVKKYDLVFIGGGPATISFICYLFQHKLSEKVFQGTNILIIEKNENFGSGCLGNYGINTNTSSEGFPRIICQTEAKDKYTKEGLSPSKKPMKVSKNYNENQDLNRHKNKPQFKNSKEGAKENANAANLNLRKEKINTLRNNQKKYSNNLSSAPTLLNKNLHYKVYNNENNNNTSEGEEGNDNENNNYLLNKEKYIYRPITIFSEVFNSSSVQTLLAIGNRPAPLSLVGYYLNCLGNFIVDFINSKYNKNILINKAEVKQVKLFNNQEFGVLVTRSNSSTNALEYSDKSNINQIIVKTKCLVIATGGKQDELNPYYSKIQEFKGINNVFRSDYLLREEGYEKMLKSILESYLRNPSNSKTDENNAHLNLKKKKIVIIGGSHSGFSCAWILLNDPSTYKNIKIGADYKPKFNPNCAECLKYTIKHKYLLKKSLNAINKAASENFDNAEESKEDKSTKINQHDCLNTDENLESELLDKEFLEKNINSSNYEEELEKLKPCNCMGAVQKHIWEYQSFNELENKDLSLFQKILENEKADKASSNNNNENSEEKLDNKNDSILLRENESLITKTEDNKKLIHSFISYVKNNMVDIQILFRDHIRVYYPSEQDAMEDNYTVYNKKEAINKQGKVYPFIGIRGDAKELYRKVIRGDEKRITLIKTSSNEEQKRYIQDSDYVIWACGYNTNNIKILDSKNHPIEFLLEESGMVEVSKQLNILNKTKEPIKNLYGIGQGFSTKAPEMINGKKARADSIHLYNTHISQRLYNSLQGLFSKNNIDFHYKNANGIGSGNFYQNTNNAINTGFSNNANNNFNLNMRKKIAEKGVMPPVTNQNANFGNYEFNLNQRKNSGGLVNEDVNNAFKQTGLSINTNNLVTNNRVAKIGNSNFNKPNNLNSTNNQDANLNVKNNINHLRISKLNTLKPSNTNNQNLENSSTNRAITNYKNKLINNRIQVNGISNNPQINNRTKNLLSKETDRTLENATINLNNTADFNENIDMIPEYPTLKVKKRQISNKINLLNNSLEEKDLEMKEKNSGANSVNRKFLNYNQLKNQITQKRKPLTSLQNEGMNYQRQRSVNIQQSQFNANNLLNNGEFSDKKKNKNWIDNERIKKASSQNNKLLKNSLERFTNNPNPSSKNPEFSLGVVDDINKKIQIQMEKINNDEILKNYNDSVYSGGSKLNSNLNLPGFNSLNEMNKQTHYYTNIRKENLSNTFSKKNYGGTGLNDQELHKINCDSGSDNKIDFMKTDIKINEKAYLDREKITIVNDNLGEESGNVIVTN